MLPSDDLRKANGMRIRNIILILCLGLTAMGLTGCPKTYDPSAPEVSDPSKETGELVQPTGGASSESKGETGAVSQPTQ